MRIGIISIIVYLVLVMSWPSNACACDEINNEVFFLKIILLLIYLFVLPVILFAIGGRVKYLITYFIAFVLSCVTWFYVDALYYLTPSIPFVLIFIMCKSTYNKQINKY
jgi:hypothetical protein